LPEYKGIQVKVPGTEVAPEEVDSALDRLRERHATFSELEGQPLEIGSFAVIDFTTAVDGQPLLEAFPDAPKILQHNVYGWFDRAERGVYVLTDAGRAALKRWPQQPVEVADAGELAPA